MLCLYFFFFFKQKTAYEMRISDWSSDVCSSDLRGLKPHTIEAFRLGFAPRQRGVLAKALRARGITLEQLIEAGLVKRAEEGERVPPDGTGEAGLRDYFFHREIFPITDRPGRGIDFGGRAPGASKAKYLN